MLRNAQQRQEQVLYIYYLGVGGLVVECQTCNFQVAGSNLTASHLQVTLSK